MTDRFHTVEISDTQCGLETLRMVTVKSSALKRRADITVWVPQAEPIKGLLILLHGVWGSHWVWSMKGGVHRTAQRLLAAGEIGPMVIAMPSDGLLRDGSAYLDWPGGENVERWIVDEVPAAAALAAPAISAGTPVALGGLSMGGYGALRLGAKYANRFCAISLIPRPQRFQSFRTLSKSLCRSIAVSEPRMNCRRCTGCVQRVVTCLPCDSIAGSMTH